MLGFRLSSEAKLAALLAVLLSLTVQNSAQADRDEDYELGVEAYNRGNFPIANKYFLDAVKEGNSNAIVMLYLAHSYAAQGQYKLALPIYRNIRDNFKGTAEAAQAGDCVVRLENPAAYAAGRSDKSSTTFYNRIKVIFPKGNQAAVSKETITTVQKAITSMPRAIYQILDSGQVKVSIAFSAKDQFPANNISGAAILSGKTICVFEKSMVGKSIKAFSQTDIREAFLMQAGQAVSECHGGLSRDPDFHNAYKTDSQVLPDGLESTLPFLTPPANNAEREVCTIIIAGLSGGNSKVIESVTKNFPKTRAWIINKLRLQS